MNEKSLAAWGISEEAIAEARAKQNAKAQRKAQSFQHCRIPDWTGSGGMVDFWINQD